GGIRMVVMGSFSGTLDEAKHLLREVGIKHAVVKVWGKAEIGDLEEALVREVDFKKGMVVINKKDVAVQATIDETISLAAQLDLPTVAVSALKREGFDALSQRLFDLIGLIRVFTIKDGVASEKPLVVPIGSTVQDVANIIHRDLAGGLRYARVWGRSARFPGQRVGKDHLLETDDRVELVWSRSGASEK
ncbi:MAG: TGS domain-containing protein, partial [Aigarchaeota archaeon]|nr:TGS domain-containing protein [Aigarchaeota archaeon]